MVRRPVIRRLEGAGTRDATRPAPSFACDAIGATTRAGTEADVARDAIAGGGARARGRASRDDDWNARMDPS